jgi:orotidine-5'-phosphate decarboxylase
VADVTTRDKLALALDVGDLADALQLAKPLAPWFAVAKVGLELFTAAGPTAVESLAGEGFSIFLDLKMHDIPTTVGRAAARARALGATYLTTHLAGGEAMVRAAVEGFGAGQGGGGVLGVTVLTSEPEAPASLVARRVEMAAATGCAGVVCAGSDLPTVRAAVPGVLAVVPGIRLAGSDTNDQARVASPGEAIRSGAGLLVLGRSVTHASDPASAAAEVARQVEEAQVTASFA